MTARIEPLLTIADWDAIPYDECNRYEIIEGVLFVSCSSGLTHQIVTSNLIFLIQTFLESNPIGEVVPTPGLVLSNISGVIPDVVIFLNEQREKIVTGERLTGPPAVVIEILSPGPANIRRDRVAKLNLYAMHGVPEYWIVDPKNLSLERYILRESSLELLETLTGEDDLTVNALPGFSCPMSRVFKRI